MKSVFIRVYPWLLLTSQLIAADPISDALQKGLFEEEANHNLDAAIKAYQSVIDQTAEQRKLTATAVFRLGECYRKLNKTNEAIGQYQRVVREFSDVATLVTLSRQNLGALGINVSNDRGTTAATSDEAEEIEKIKAMVKYSPDLINAADRSSGMTPLDVAALKGHLAVARFLLDNKAGVDVKGNNAYTALHHAANAGHKSMAELLLDRGADVNAGADGSARPLHLAALQGYPSIVELLLARKADINPKGERGRTPLHNAVSSGRHTAIAKVLLDRGADVNAQDNDGQTALHYAVSSPELTELLLSYKPNIELADQEGKTALIAAAGSRGSIRSVELLLQAGADVNKMTPKSVTPLMAAVWISDVEKARLLLEHKADPNQKLQMGGSPLKWVLGPTRNNISSAEKAKLTEIADLLRKYGAKDDGLPDPPLQVSTPADDAETKELERLQTAIKDNPDLVNLRDQQRETPLHRAAGVGQLKVAQFLLKNGADVNAREQNNATPLHKAVYVGNKQMVELLLTNGADPNAVGSYGSYVEGQYLQGQPLHSAINEGRFAIAETLLAHGADVNGKFGRKGYGSENRTALHLAVEKGYFESARLLLSKGADVNARDNMGRTALLLAVKSGQERIVRLLLDKGADVNAQDNEGFSTLHFAVWQASPAIVGAFLEKKPNLHAEDKDGYTPLFYALDNRPAAEMLLKAGANPNGHSSKDRSLLFYAVHGMKSKEAVKLLLDYKADPNKPTAEGVTPLMCALDPINASKLLQEDPQPLTQTQQKALAEIVELLRAHGAKDHVRSAELKP